MRVDTTPNAMYEAAAKRDAKKGARVRLENTVMAYVSVVAPHLGADDSINVTLQAVDAVEEILAGYPNK